MADKSPKKKQGKGKRRKEKIPKQNKKATAVVKVKKDNRATEDKNKVKKAVNNIKRIYKIYRKDVRHLSGLEKEVALYCKMVKSHQLAIGHIAGKIVGGDTNGTGNDKSIASLCKKLNGLISRVNMSNMIHAARLEDYLKGKGVATDELSFSHLVELTRVQDKAEQVRLAKLAIKEKLSVRELSKERKPPKEDDTEKDETDNEGEIDHDDEDENDEADEDGTKSPVKKSAGKNGKKEKDAKPAQKSGVQREYKKLLVSVMNVKESLELSNPNGIMLNSIQSLQTACSKLEKVDLEDRFELHLQIKLLYQRLHEYLAGLKFIDARLMKAAKDLDEQREWKDKTKSKVKQIAANAD